MKHHVFISYVHRDDKYAAQIEQFLKGKRFRCWRDHYISLGADFAQVIERAIADCQVVLDVITPGADPSEWLLREIGMAQERRVPVLPVVIDRRGLPKRLQPALERLNWFEMKTEGDACTSAKLDELAAELRAMGVGSLTYEIDQVVDGESLEGALPALQGSDFDRIATLADLTAQHFRGTPGGSYPTVHGLRHTNGVLRLLGSILPEEVRSSRNACFALAAAACLHDWGRLTRECPPSAADATAGQKEQVGREEICCLPRSEHHRRSRQNVLDLAAELRFDVREVNAVAAVTYYHNFRTNPQELLRQPETANLAAFFRIANACDMGPMRAPALYCWAHKEEIWGDQLLRDLWSPGATGQQNSQDAATEASLSAATFWLQNLMVKDVRVCHEERTIVIAGRIPYGLDFIPRQIVVNLERLLVGLLPLIGEWHAGFDGEELPEDETAMDLGNTVLLGARMYADPGAVLRSSSDIADYFVRSVLALGDRHDAGADAGEVLKTLKALSANLARERPELHLLHSLQARFEERLDLAHPEASLGKIREEFQGLAHSRRLYPVKDGNEYHGAFGAIAAGAFEKLREIMRAGPKPWPGDPDLTCLVFGQSGPVSAFIEYCALAGKRVTVLTPLMRPVGDGPVSQAREKLKDRVGVTVEVIPDAAMAHVLRTRCDLALMGCEALLENGDVANSLGALVFAQVVKKNGGKLWVLTERAKKCPDEKRQCSPWHTPDVKPGELPVSAFMHEPAASAAARKLTTEYPRSEIVPACLIDCIITEPEPPGDRQEQTGQAPEVR
jgi:hypothetical protein